MADAKLFPSILHAAIRTALARDERELAALLLQTDIASAWSHDTGYRNDPYNPVSVNLVCSPEALDLLRPYAADRRDERGETLSSVLQDLLNDAWPPEEVVSSVSVTVRLEELEGELSAWLPSWREQLRDLIESGPSNQGRPFGTSPVITHGGLNYRSRSEVAIAQVLEQSEDILFLPNCTALSGKVQKEPDFLIFYSAELASWRSMGRPMPAA